MHLGLLYADPDAYVAGIAGFLREGLEAGEPVMMAAPPANVELVRDALGPDAGAVAFHDMTRAGRNPGRIIGGVLTTFTDEHAGAERVRIVGEPIWAGRTPDEYAVAAQHEALINLALAERPVTVLCPYDGSALDARALADAHRTHPLVVEGDVTTPSSDYADPAVLARELGGPLAEPEELGETLVFHAPTGPRTVRRAVAEHARRAGLPDERTSDLCLAAHEVAVNTVVHTDGPGILSLWTTVDGAVVVEVQDGGWIGDPLAGRYPAGPGEGRGFGLRLVHELCDLVQVHTDPAAGTTVRMTMRR